MYTDSVYLDPYPPQVVKRSAAEGGRKFLAILRTLRIIPPPLFLKTLAVDSVTADLFFHFRRKDKMTYFDIRSFDL